MEPTKRELRQVKKEIKRTGSQRRRRQWKRDLRESPEEAPYSESDFGRYSTVGLNGMDRDNTRRRGRSTEDAGPVRSPDSDDPLNVPRKLEESPCDPHSPIDARRIRRHRT